MRLVGVNRASSSLSLEALSKNEFFGTEVNDKEKKAFRNDEEDMLRKTRELTG